MSAPNVRYGLRDIPRTEFGDGFGVRATDMEAGIVVGNIAAATILPSRIGLPFTNKTGSTIPLGALLYVNGQDATTGNPTVALAANNVAGARAQFTAQAAVLNNGVGLMGEQMSLTAQNTNAGNVGDPVYLSATPGAYTLTAPAVAGTFVQIVGRITVKSATVGVVILALLYNDVPTQISTNEIVPASVTGALLSVNQSVRRQNVSIGTITATGEVITRAPITGAIATIAFTSATTLGTSGSNNVVFTSINKGTGAGSTALLTGAAQNSTNTGGSALAAYTPLAFALGATLTVTGGDVLTFAYAVTGTLTINEALVTFVFTSTT